MRGVQLTPVGSGSKTLDSGGSDPLTTTIVSPVRTMGYSRLVGVFQANQSCTLNILFGSGQTVALEVVDSTAITGGSGEGAGQAIDLDITGGVCRIDVVTTQATVVSFAFYFKTKQ